MTEQGSFHGVPSAEFAGANVDSVTATLQRVQSVVQRHARARASDASDHAPEFNVFDFFGHREVILSRVIAWMLDPNSTHGEGTAFLKHFLRMFTPEVLLDEERLRGAVITREAGTIGPTRSECGRYIDVLIELAGGESIAIENKLTGTAPWMEEQLRCYRAHIQRRAGSERHWVVALIGWSADAQAEVARHWGPDLPDDGSVKGYDRSQVAEWTLQCASASHAPTVRQFLQNFEQFLDRPHGQGAKSMRQTAELAELLVRDGDSFASALAIADALPLAKERLVQTMNQQFRQEVEERGWEVPQGPRDEMLSALTGETGLHIRFQRDLPWVFSLTFYRNDLQDPYWGIRSSEKVDHSDEKGLKDRFNKALWSARGPELHWIWWSKKDVSFGDIWCAVQDGSLVRRVLQKASSLEQKVPDLLAPHDPL